MRSTWQCLLWCWYLDTYFWQKALPILAVAVRWNVSSVSFGACHWRYFCCFWLWCPLSPPVDCQGWRDFDWVQVKQDLKQEIQSYATAFIGENTTKNCVALQRELIIKKMTNDETSWPWEEELCLANDLEPINISSVSVISLIGLS